MNDEFIEEIEEDTTQSDLEYEVESDISSTDSVSEDIAYDDFIYEDVSEVVVDDVRVEDYNIFVDDSLSISESDEQTIIDYSVPLDNISNKLDNIVSSISDNKVDYVYDYNFNIVSVLLLSTVVGVLLFSLFTRRF